MRAPRPFSCFSEGIKERAVDGDQKMRCDAAMGVATIAIPTLGTVQNDAFGTFWNPWNALETLGTLWNPWNSLEPPLRSWNRIDRSHGRPGSAAEDSLRCEIAALRDAVLLDRLFTVVAARHGEPALKSHAGVDRGHRRLIQVNAADGGGRRPLAGRRAAQVESDRDQDDRGRCQSALLHCYRG